MAELAVIGQKGLRNEQLVLELRKLLERAESGELTQLLAVMGTRDHYEHLKVGMTTCEALGAAARATYAFNKVWDHA